MSLAVAILAGGLGTRLHPLTSTLPKCLLEVRGEPFLVHQLRLLRDSGVDHAVLCLGHLGEMVRDFLHDGSRLGMRIDYSFDGPVLRGTGGAIRNALALLGEEFFVMYGDSYLTCDYQLVERAFLTCGKPALMTVFRNEGRWDTSNVEFDGATIRAYDKLHRTPRMRHIDYGLGAFHRCVFERYADSASFDLAEVYRDLLARGELAAIGVVERFYEIGSIEGLQDLEAFLSRKR